MAAVTPKSKRIEKCERGVDDSKQQTAGRQAEDRKEGVCQSSSDKEEQMKGETCVITTPGGVPLSEANVPSGNWMAVDRNRMVYVNGCDLSAVRSAKRELKLNFDVALEKASSWEEQTLFLEQDS